MKKYYIFMPFLLSATYSVHAMQTVTLELYEAPMQTLALKSYETPMQELVLKAYKEEFGNFSEPLKKEENGACRVTFFITASLGVPCKPMLPAAKVLFDSCEKYLCDNNLKQEAYNMQTVHLNANTSYAEVPLLPFGFSKAYSVVVNKGYLLKLEVQ